MSNNIQKLLDRYFEGETSREEEKELRELFANRDIPDEFLPLVPIFDFLKDEEEAITILNEIKQEHLALAKRTKRARRITRSFVAAIAVLLVAVLLIQHTGQDILEEDSYVWVDGVKITDPHVIQQHAELSFGKINTNIDLVEEQLSFFFE